MGELNEEQKRKANLKNLEKAAIIIPRINPLSKSRRKPSIQMTEPHLPIKQAEYVVIINVRGNCINRWPWCFLKHTLTQCLKRGFIHLVNLVNILLSYVSVQMNNE